MTDIFDIATDSKLTYDEKYAQLTNFHGVRIASVLETLGEVIIYPVTKPELIETLLTLCHPIK